MNFLPNKHELKRVIFIQQMEFPESKEKERERVINVKYKEISWRVRKKKKKKEKSNFQKPSKLVLKKLSSVDANKH